MRLYSIVLSLFATSTMIAVAQEDELIVDTTHISHVLDRLTNKTNYDKRLRPRYGDKPVDVGITIHVSSISAVSEVDMDFTLDFYMRQTWQDPRLAFGTLDLGMSKQINSLTVGVDYLDRLWKPDTFFPNEKKSFFHVATTHNSFLRIDSDGTVFTSQRLTVTATCPMKLQLFPMDSQRCKLEIESYGYTTADIDYFWGQKKSDPRRKAVRFDNFMLPQFKQTGYNVNITKAVTSSGEYVRLYFEVLLIRNMGFYAMNIVIPSMLIVTISWVSFWLNREASPARVGLGVTTVLTMTTLITTTNNSMPKVSYIKGLDVFLNFCFVMVFAALVEYAVVSYLNKRIALRREKRRKQAEQQRQAEVPMFSNTLSPKQPNNNVSRGMYEMSLISQNSTPAKSFAPHSDMYFGPHNSSMNQLMEIPVDCDCRTIPLIQHPRLVADGSHTMWPAPFGKPKKASKTCRNVTPAKIDKCSRYIFPLLFFGFNIMYWTIMTVLSSMSDLKNDEWEPIIIPD
ncbi:unnamed protein product [Cylicocyclus nassatus]|uniref:Uncharacterized protein n=1 Tax=Cylicocyclus nassatus TaxID=53992 RepID=A0AA36GW63_CYLNA|nr:unnamed protein product [Cylicocyclus nassatus]